MSGPKAQRRDSISKRPPSMQFRKRSNGPVPSPEQARRQSHITQSAWRHLGAPGPVIAFLNTRHPVLEGQPLHLAIESDEGLKRVEEVLDKMTLRA